MNRRKVSVIIPTLNEEQYILGILDDLSEQSYSPAEIIIADCQSTDETIKKVQAKYPDVKIAISSKKSPGAARNAGVEIANAENLLFFDADVRVKHDFIEKMMNHKDESKADITYPRFRSDGKSFAGFIHVCIVSLWLAFYRAISNNKGIGGVILCSRDAYERIGGFVENHAGEDVLFYEKAQKIRLNISQCKSTKAFLSSRRTKGIGFFRTALEDMRIFKKLAIKRSYSRYK